MGFALVDESPENEYDRRIDQAKGLPGDSTRHKQIGSAAGRERDLLGSIADDVGTAGSGGNQDQDEIRLRRAEGEELEEEARRRAFREKVEEIERAAAEKVIGSVGVFSC